MVLNAIPITSWVGTQAADPFENNQGQACRCDGDRAGGAIKASDPIISKAKPKHTRKLDRRS